MKKNLKCSPTLKYMAKKIQNKGHNVNKKQKLKYSQTWKYIPTNFKTKVANYMKHSRKKPHRFNEKNWEILEDCVVVIIVVFVLSFYSGCDERLNIRRP